MYFPTGVLSDLDLTLAHGIIGDRIFKQPDLVIAPNGEPYIYRWHLLKSQQAGYYFHIQVASDPERPLHDHPWDNMSVILSGGYDELWEPMPWWSHAQRPMTRHLRKGDVMFRKASEAHRLLLPDNIPYTMSLFSTGPKEREWGFWYEDGWRAYTEVTKLLDDGRSVHVKGG